MLWCLGWAGAACAGAGIGAAGAAGAAGAGGAAAAGIGAAGIGAAGIGAAGAGAAGIGAGAAGIGGAAGLFVGWAGGCILFFPPYFFIFSLTPTTNHLHEFPQFFFIVVAVLALRQLH